MKKWLTLGLALLVGTALVTSASADPRWGGHGGGWSRGWNGPRINYHFDNPLGSIVGGFLGGVVGSVITAPRVVVQPPPVIVQAPPVPEVVPGTGPWYAYCQQKYRSFDIASGTYLGYDGLRHQCQ